MADVVDARQLLAEILRYTEAVKRPPDLEELLEVRCASRKRLRHVQASLSLDGLASRS